jgi:VanZ family protein
MQRHSTTANTTVRWLWLLAGWLLVLLIIYLSLTPRPISVPVAEGDKIGHAVAYAVLMLWFAQLYLGKKSRIAVAAASAALGIALEFAQQLTETRDFSIADMAADGLGVLLGWLAAPPRTVNLLSWVESSWPKNTGRP